MFSRATLFTASLFVMFAAASAAPNPPPKDQCTTGSVECCNSTADASDPSVTTLAALLGINLGGVTGLVGLTCNPITVGGIGGNSCSSQTVCCTGNNFEGGLIVVGCTPIIIDV